MHHVNYTHVLHSGKTVIQHIYDSHYAGAQTIHEFRDKWAALKGLVDEGRYQRIGRQLDYQCGHSLVWRDAICQWFSNMSAIRDIHDRVGHYSGRIEAESMHLLDGYVNQTVDPWETASGGLAVECKSAKCKAQYVWTGDTGAYDITVQYYDENDGVSRFKLFVGSKVVGEWDANDKLPNSRPCGDTSIRFTAPGVKLTSGDTITVEGVPNHKENAVFDYIEIVKVA
ncbi:unnamed protein product [Oppiella nova]|uniref:Glycosyl hydrolase family 67 C-terminal domain-containing protein n=1 Tax=Oppiella nova TaxID=334625 RepID=A0A7R9QNT3_9ACAR|nr:unnamed protein product [Oppiella nova]CAG2170076.1 unnamed protein product [Oppiella nova]